MKTNQLGALILKTQKQKQTIEDLQNRSKDLKSANEHLLVRLARMQIK
jgi:predicted Zn-ribbon and HTH transcriptional regulator